MYCCHNIHTQIPSTYRFDMDILISNVIKIFVIKKMQNLHQLQENQGKISKENRNIIYGFLDYYLIIWIK